MDSLEVFHQRILDRIPGFEIPEELKRNCNQEFRAYLDGQDGSRYYQWLALAVEEHKPKVILELGTNRGASAIAMWSKKPSHSSLITVDIQNCEPFFPNEMKDSSFFFRFIGDDLDPEATYGRQYFAGEMDKVDFLFIDTDHHAEHFRKEWAIYRDWLVDGAIVAIDDINVNDMRKAWDELDYEKMDISQDCHYSGFGFMRFAK